MKSLSCTRAPKPWKFTVSGHQVLEFAALSVQGGPQILEFAAFSVQGPPNPGICSTFSAKRPPILEFAAFAEFPVFGSKKLIRWSAPRTRSERDADLHIPAPTQGIALKVLPKQAFKFKDMRKTAPDSSSLPHLQCNQAPTSFEILEFYSIFSAMRSPNAGICSTFSAMRRPNPGICSTLSEFLQCLTATRPPHRALTAEISGFPPFWGSLRRGIHIISDCGNHFRGCENLWHHCVQLKVSLEGQMSRNTYKTRYTPKKRDWQEFR